VFDKKIILVTGGIGSFGQAFISGIMNKYNPKKIIIFSRDEMKQWEMAKTYKSSNPQRKYILFGKCVS